MVSDAQVEEEKRRFKLKVVGQICSIIEAEQANLTWERLVYVTCLACLITEVGIPPPPKSSTT